MHPFSHVRSTILNPPERKPKPKPNPYKMTADDLFALPYNEIVEIRQKYPTRYATLAAEQDEQPVFPGSR